MRQQLKQIGLALANYEGALGSYPYGGGWWNNAWSSHVMLLPFIEQQNAYNTFNFADLGQMPSSTRRTRRPAT